MSDLAPVFNIIVDDVTKGGEALVSRIEGEVGAGKEGLIGFSFKDSSGNVILPSLDASGNLPVTLEGIGLPKNGFATVDPAVVGTYEDIIAVSLTISKTHEKIQGVVSCTRDAAFKLVQNDNSVNADMSAPFMVGPGQYTFEIDLKQLQVTSSAVGPQELIIQGKILSGAKSDLHATLSFVESAV